MFAWRFWAWPLLCLVTFAGCGGAAANYPDGAGVVAAQREWCEALAKIHAPEGNWEHLSACKDAYPTASAAYLRGMTKCFVERLQALGDEAPDHSQVLADCNEEVVVSLSGGEAASKGLVEARCKRMQRCEDIAVDECKTAFTKLENAQQAMFTTTYNLAAQTKIASCLDSDSCTDNEEEARDACYKPLGEKLLWFPD